jgi:hypothetical protein
MMANAKVLVLLAAVLVLQPAATRAEEVHTVVPGPIGIPVQIDKDHRKDIQELRLYVSQDQGRTWKSAGKLKPDQPAFSYNAEQEGEHWFFVQSVMTDGRKYPEGTHSVPPALKVRVQAGAKGETSKAATVEAWKKELEELRARVKELEERLKKVEQKEKE